VFVFVYCTISCESYYFAYGVFAIVLRFLFLIGSYPITCDFRRTTSLHLVHPSPCFAPKHCLNIRLALSSPEMPLAFAW